MDAMWKVSIEIAKSMRKKNIKSNFSRFLEALAMINSMFNFFSINGSLAHGILVYDKRKKWKKEWNMNTPIRRTICINSLICCVLLHAIYKIAVCGTRKHKRAWYNHIWNKNFIMFRAPRTQISTHTHITPSIRPFVHRFNRFLAHRIHDWWFKPLIIYCTIETI